MLASPPLAWVGPIICTRAIRVWHAGRASRESREKWWTVVIALQYIPLVVC